MAVLFIYLILSLLLILVNSIQCTIFVGGCLRVKAFLFVFFVFVHMYKKKKKNVILVERFKPLCSARFHS